MEVPALGLLKRLERGRVRIASQHEQLAGFREHVLRCMQRGEVHSAQRAFARFADALEAHMSLEEGMYFPALCGLTPAARHPLEGLADEHIELRRKLAAVAALLESFELELSSEYFSVLIGELAAHEATEDRLVAEFTLTAHSGPE